MSLGSWVRMVEQAKKMSLFLFPVCLVEPEYYPEHQEPGL